MSDKATLRPWKVNRREVEFEIDGQIGSISNYQIVTAWNHPQLKAPEVIIGISQRYGGPTITTREANTRYIVKACNAHDALVAAAKAALHQLNFIVLMQSLAGDEQFYIDQLRAALALASPDA